MLKKFMSPSFGEGVYNPPPKEAKLALDALDAYTRKRVADNAQFVTLDPIAPGRVDSTLSLFLEDGDIGVLGIPPEISFEPWVIILSSTGCMWRYLWVAKSLVVRVDQSEAIATMLVELSESGEEGEATSVAAAELDVGATPFIAVGQIEATGLIGYLATGRPFVPDADLI